ncbi:MAG: FHA domain-containing protein [Anaerolineaceae bacterium]|nr:FHA domain-containing protein [Anaerolineaceae bacterium]
MAKSFKLIIESGPSAGTELLLEKEDLTLGRDVNNDLVINDPEVSRKHARLLKEGDSYVYEDLGSTNGTFILGERLSRPTLLVPNSKITIGERVQLSFVVEGADPSETVVAARHVQQPPVQPPAAYVPPTPPAAVPAVSSTSIPPKPPVQAVQPSAPVPPPPGMAVPPMPKKKNKGLVILLIILAVIVVFCVIPFILIDVTNNWCNLFGSIFQLMGACY